MIGPVMAYFPINTKPWPTPVMIDSLKWALEIKRTFIELTMQWHYSCVQNNLTYLFWQRLTNFSTIWSVVGENYNQILFKSVKEFYKKKCIFLWDDYTVSSLPDDMLRLVCFSHKTILVSSYDEINDDSGYIWIFHHHSCFNISSLCDNCLNSVQL